jgi:hypothetical protein
MPIRILPGVDIIDALKCANKGDSVRISIVTGAQRGFYSETGLPAGASMFDNGIALEMLKGGAGRSERERRQFIPQGVSGR